MCIICNTFTFTFLKQFFNILLSGGEAFGGSMWPVLVLIGPEVTPQSSKKPPLSRLVANTNHECPSRKICFSAHSTFVKSENESQGQANKRAAVRHKMPLFEKCLQRQKLRFLFSRRVFMLPVVARRDLLLCNP